MILLLCFVNICFLFINKFFNSLGSGVDYTEHIDGVRFFFFWKGKTEFFSLVIGAADSI